MVVHQPTGDVKVGCCLCITKVIKMYPLDTMNVCINIHGNTSNRLFKSQAAGHKLSQTSLCKVFFSVCFLFHFTLVSCILDHDSFPN